MYRKEVHGGWYHVGISGFKPFFVSKDQIAARRVYRTLIDMGYYNAQWNGQDDLAKPSPKNAPRTSNNTIYNMMDDQEAQDARMIALASIPFVVSEPAPVGGGGTFDGGGATTSWDAAPSSTEPPPSEPSRESESSRESDSSSSDSSSSDSSSSDSSSSDSNS